METVPTKEMHWGQAKT